VIFDDTILAHPAVGGLHPIICGLSVKPHVIDHAASVRLPKAVLLSGLKQRLDLAVQRFQ